MTAVASMTGHGVGTSRGESGTVEVEITTVNRRHFDFHVQWPIGWARFEPEVARRVRKSMTRGRIQVGVRWVPAAGAEAPDTERLAEWLQSARELGRRLGVEDDLTLSTVLRYREREGAEPVPPPTEAAVLLEAALEEAVAACVIMRQREGALLVEELNGLLQAMSPHLSAVRAAVPGLVEVRAGKLRQRLLDAGLDAETLQPAWEREVALLADRMDVREELVRLDAHREAIVALLGDGGEVGRKLDFLLQEVLREVGTLGTKCGDADVARHLVDVKATLEKMREQAQNLE